MEELRKNKKEYENNKKKAEEQVIIIRENATSCNCVLVNPTIHSNTNQQLLITFMILISILFVVIFLAYILKK